MARSRRDFDNMLRLTVEKASSSLSLSRVDTIPSTDTNKHGAL